VQLDHGSQATFRTCERGKEAAWSVDKILTPIVRVEITRGNCDLRASWPLVGRKTVTNRAYSVSVMMSGIPSNPLVMIRRRMENITIWEMKKLRPYLKIATLFKCTYLSGEKWQALTYVIQLSRSQKQRTSAEHHASVKSQQAELAVGWHHLNRAKNSKVISWIWRSINWTDTCRKALVEQKYAILGILSGHILLSEQASGNLRLATDRSHFCVWCT
jgi:hypothetical protein